MGGLTDHEAGKRLLTEGPNVLAEHKRAHFFLRLALKFVNPLVIVLLTIATISTIMGDLISAGFVAAMAVISVLLSFIQEERAGREADKLSEMVRTTATVWRNGKSREVKLREIVPGDIVDLLAGDMIPADLRILQSKDLFINQSSLTGESFPAEKHATLTTGKHDSLTGLTNIAFMGSSVVSGTALCLVIRTGVKTQFGEISKRLATGVVQTGFDRGIRDLTWLMLRAMAVLVIVIFAINAYHHGNLLEAFLFSLAVAVGLTPEMLPMVIAMNLSKGAIALAKKKVIVKHLNSIQNFGSMDVLCTDKTGTLTLDKVVLERYCDVQGKEDDTVLRYSYINSFFQTGLKGLIDRTILEHGGIALKDIHKVDEIPFDFERKIMSVVVAINGRHRLIAKGAPEEIYRRCTHYKLLGKILPIEPENMSFLREEYDRLSADGFRVIAVAYRDEATSKRVFEKKDEEGLILRGYLAFLDPPKPSARETIEALRRLGVEVKVLTGDNDIVARKICADVGLNVATIVTGEQMKTMPEAVLQRLVKTTSVFARLDPMQKERIITAIRGGKHTVGFLGDGINDAPALKAADVGISVNNAVDIAKESADLILLQKNLMVLRDGVLEGRRIFGNILKYIRMGTSSNFGNMLSMTGASLFLPFLPMLPIQILLNNFLYDLSQLAIPTDHIDHDELRKPHAWDISAIQHFMLVFGPISSLFDFLTFGILLWGFHASEAQFHTGWFMESLLTQTFVIYVIRTKKIPFLQSWPSSLLLFSTLFLVLVGFAVPFSPFASAFGFLHLPGTYFLVLAALVLTYLCLVQMVKVWFFRRMET